MGSITAGLYARVSTDGQARGNTIASQLAALQERACADAIRIDPHHAYVDEGRSGATLARPALERLRMPWRAVNSSDLCARTRPTGPAVCLPGPAH